MTPAMPVFVKGMGGRGAAHVFHMQRRESLSSLAHSLFMNFPNVERMAHESLSF